MLSDVMAPFAREDAMLRRLAFSFALLVTSLTLLAGYQWARLPATYEQAVAEVLERRKLPFASLEVHTLCLPDPSCTIHNGAQISMVVLIYHARVSYGRVTCYNRGGNCYLDSATLNITRAPLRDLRRVRLHATRLGRTIEALLALLEVEMRAQDIGAKHSS
jgi:hypothetical protein